MHPYEYNHIYIYMYVYPYMHKQVSTNTYVCIYIYVQIYQLSSLIYIQPFIYLSNYWWMYLSTHLSFYLAKWCRHQLPALQQLSVSLRFFSCILMHMQVPGRWFLRSFCTSHIEYGKDWTKKTYIHFSTCLDRYKRTNVCICNCLPDNFTVPLLIKFH